ncbi:MAG: hypothetical protein QM784_36740 [Polyangiaceae bacterium]
MIQTRGPVLRSGSFTSDLLLASEEAGFEARDAPKRTLGRRERDRRARLTKVTRAAACTFGRRVECGQELLRVREALVHIFSSALATTASSSIESSASSVRTRGGRTSRC